MSKINLPTAAPLGLPADRCSQLTKSERDVLAAFARLARVQDVANELGRSHHTVNTQLKNARRKLGVADSLSAARILMGNGHHQNLGNQYLGIADDPIPSLVGPGPTPIGEDINAVREEHRPFVYDEIASLPAAPNGDRDARLRTLRLIAAIAALVSLILIAAPAIYDSAAERIANSIEPPHQQ